MKKRIKDLTDKELKDVEDLLDTMPEVKEYFKERGKRRYQFLKYKKENKIKFRKKGKGSGI